MLLFTNARIVDGNGVILERGNLLVQDGKIARVTSDQIQEPAADTFDLAGLTLLPGLMNAHTHICLDGGADPEATLRGETATETALRAARRLHETLQMGVTTIRDLGGIDGIDIALMRMVERGEIDGPRMLAAGRVVTMTGGHGYWTGMEADGPDGTRRAARTQLKAGARVIKVMATGGMMTPGQMAGAPQLTVEEMAAAIEEAHKAGRGTAAHIESAIGAKNAILAGIDSVEHGHGADQEVIDMMLERGTALVPTILSDVAIIVNGKAAGIPDFVVEKCELLHESLLSALDLAFNQGVEIAAGNDGGAPFVHCGDIAGELELYVKHGMRPQKALATATINTARLFRLDDVGQIRAGFAADLLVVAGDPLADIGALRNVQYVVRAGKLVRRPA